MRRIEVIHLARRDNIDTASELLLHATPGAQVWLTVPWRHALGLKLINLKRLRRIAEDAGIDLRLISRHQGTRGLAREAGLPVYSAGPWRLRSYRQAQRQAGDDLTERIRSYHGELGFWYRRRPRHVSLGATLLALVIVGLLGVVLVGVAAALVPGAEVVLEPLSEPVSAEAKITVDSLYDDIDYGQAIIPGRVLQVITESTGETPASGRLDVDDEHASGDVVFANRTNEPVFIPKGTVVRTTSGLNVRFYTVADVEVPGQLFAHRRVGVIALEPGPAGNVQALTIKAIESDVSNRVEVINDSPTTGGTVRRMPIVHPDDFDRLRAQMIATMQEEALAELVKELEEGEYIPKETVDVRVMSQEFDQVIDQRSDVLSMRMKVVARGLAVDGQALDELATALLVQSAGGDKQLIPDSLRVERPDNVEIDDSQLAAGIKKAGFTIHAEGMVTSTIDEVQVKRALRGKSVEDARSWLMSQFTLRSEPSITMMPEWWERLPFLPARLDLTVSSGEA